MQNQERTEAIVSEIKQFVVFFSYIMDRVIQSNLKTQSMSQEEIQIIDNIKYQINDFYNHFQMNQNRSIVPLIRLCVKSIIQNETYPTNLLGVTIKMLTKIFEQGNESAHFYDQKSGQLFNPDEMLHSLMECQFDDHFNTIDHQEQLWLNIQTLILRVLEKLTVTKDCPFKVIGFFLKFLDQRGFTCDQRQGQTIHFTEKVKKNTLKLLNLLFTKGHQKEAFKILADMVLTAISIHNKPIELDEQKQPRMTQLEKNKINEKQIKVICYGLKSTQELLENQKASLAEFIKANIKLIVQMTCTACEQEDMIVKNQGQMLFQLLMNQIVGQKLHLREEFEILYVKCVLKPILNRIKKINEEKKKEKSKADAIQEKQETTRIDQQLSDQEDPDEEQENQPIGDPLLHASSYGEKGGKDSGQIDSESKDYSSDLEFEFCYNFIVEVIIQLKPEDLGLLFLSYDCQHFSENIITKSLNLIIKYGKHDQKKFTRVFERLSHGLAQLTKNDTLEEQIVHMTHQRIKYMLDTKSQQKTLARQCNIKPKLLLNKCQEIYGLVDKEAPWDIASKILLFSREIIVEHVTEILGGKEDRNKAIYGYFLDKQDFRDNNLEKSLRRVMQTFRLAGVESQCVTRVLEGFGEKFFQYDSSNSFIDAEEAYEMAFLMIVLQTTQHNPNIKQKLRLKDFEITAKSNCPKSYDNTLPSNFVETMFENIKAEEILSPLTRNWYEQEFNQADLTYCQIKLSSFTDERQLTSNEFINLADLTSNQLFNFNNRFDSVKPEENSLLVFGALRNLVQMLTKEFLKSSDLQNPRDKLVLRNMLKSNQTLLNYGFTDRLIRGLCKIDSNHENLLKEIITNFDKGAQNTVTLIPQLVIGNKSVPDLGKIEKNHLLEICQAAERYFRKKLSDSQSDIKRKIMTFEGKTAAEIDEVIKRNKNEMTAKIPQSSTSSQSDLDKQSSYSFVNIVFNYFNDTAQDGASGENIEQIQKLKRKADKLKTDQIEHMKQMNKIFANLSNAGSELQSAKSEHNDSFEIYLESQLLCILQKILAVFKDNLNMVIQSKDGLYCLLFINNCIQVLYQEDCQVANKKECLKLIWQEMHVIMCKLSNTKRKVNLLGQGSSSRRSEDEFFSDQRETEDGNLSQLESGKSEELNYSQDKSSSEQSNSLNQEMKQIQTFSEGSKVNISFTTKKTKSYERRVFQSLCKHLILEAYFDINKQMIEDLSGISQLQADKESIDKILNDQNIQKDLNETVREVQRVFKSIVNGPQDKNEDDSDVQEEDQLTQSRMFDDLHAIICMNRFLSVEFKYLHNDSELLLLPVSTYTKIYKLLRNLIINSCSSVDETQIEVYVQNSDAFIDVITYCLKYIQQQMTASDKQLVPYHLIDLIVQLISKISSKSQLVGIAEPIPQFLSIFERIFKIMKVQNQFDLWIEIMKQYQQILILNKDLISNSHEGTFNHVLLQYKNQVLAVCMEIFGEVGQKQFDMNIQKMFEELFFQITIQEIAAKFDIKNPNEEVLYKLRLFCKVHLEQTTDVLIQMLDQIYTYNLDDEQLQQLFVTLWFPYLRTQLKFVDLMNELAPVVKDNFTRILQFLMEQNILIDTQPKIWNESWTVISSFFPDVKDNLLQQ